MLTVNAYAAPSADAPLEPTTISRREVGPNDVLIEIAYAGICHSDIHTVNGDWGPQPYPLVPGHEIVGTVTEVGSTKDFPGTWAGVPELESALCIGWGVAVLAWIFHVAAMAMAPRA